MKTKDACLSEISMEHLERMAGALKILAHPCRLKMIEILQREGDCPVHVVMDRLQIPQATISQHLNQMRRAGLVKASRKGKEVWYGIADPSALTILDCIRRKQGGGG
ncbi:MAG: metalloregulator ArsR/SmtB family transcription factor [bacterium]